MKRVSKPNPVSARGGGRSFI